MYKDTWQTNIIPIILIYTLYGKFNSMSHFRNRQDQFVLYSSQNKQVNIFTFLNTFTNSCWYKNG